MTVSCHSNMDYCKSILLCNIVAILCKASDFCAYGPDSFDSAYCGEYQHRGTMYNGDNVYELTNVGNQCENYKLYRSNNRWYFGQTLGGSFNARCQSETILPSDCTAFERNIPLNALSVSIGSCPVFGCSNIRITGSGRSDCDGIFTKCAANIYRRSCDPNSSEYNAANWAFSNKKRKFYCTNTDPRNDCSVSGIRSQQKNAEVLVMIDGDSKSVVLSSYFSSGYQDKTALFQCGVPFTTSPTPKPTNWEALSPNYCAVIPEPYSFIGGEYRDSGSIFNGDPVYELVEAGNGCSNLKLYRSNNVWYFGETLPGQTSIYSSKCLSESITPSQCDRFTADGLSITAGSCPIFGCSNIRITGSGRSDCDGIFIKCDTNIYRRSCDPNHPLYNEKNYAFSPKRQKFICSNTDSRDDCSVLGIGSIQKNAEFLVMNDGDLRSVILTSYLIGGYQDKNALFQCGVEITQSPTSNPTEPIGNTDICLCNPSGFYLSNGEYYDRHIEFNGKPTYKMLSKYDGSEYYIYFVVSGVDGYWLMRDSVPINEINYVVPFLGIKNENDPVIALGIYAEYGPCSCGKIIV